MSNKELIKELDTRITALSKEGTTLEGYVATSQAIAQMIIAKDILIKQDSST